MVPVGNNARKTEQLGSAEDLGTLAAAYSCVCTSLCSCTLHKLPCGGDKRGLPHSARRGTLKNVHKNATRVRSGPDHVE